VTEEPPRELTAVSSETEAELVRNLLADHGIPALIRPQSAFMQSLQAGGGQTILVPAAAYDRARQVISGADSQGESPK
jgi:hypothetical protein